MGIGTQGDLLRDWTSFGWLQMTTVEEKKLSLGQKLAEEASKNRATNAQQALEKWIKEVVDPCVKKGVVTFSVQTCHFKAYFGISDTDRDHLAYVFKFLKEQGISAKEDIRRRYDEEGNNGWDEPLGTMSVSLDSWLSFAPQPKIKTYANYVPPLSVSLAKPVPKPVFLNKIGRTALQTLLKGTKSIDSYFT
jgi:hypothetical protein